MKRIVLALFNIISMPLTLFANKYADTTIQGVRVQFVYNRSIFPDSWLTAETDATGEPIALEEINRTKQIMVKGLAKYPYSVLRKELMIIYFLKSMSIYHVGFGGTNSNNAIYLTNDGAALGYTDLYIEQTFHHEFSSILYRNYPSLLDTVFWKAANIPNFDYNDPEGGVGAIRTDSSSQHIDTSLCRKGFLTQYACSGIENDINTIAQNLFKPTAEFWHIVNNFPRINEKVNLLIKFYTQINPIFTKQYFMKMN